VCERGVEELYGEEELRISGSADQRISGSKPVRLFVYSPIRLLLATLVNSRASTVRSLRELALRAPAGSSIRLFFTFIIYDGESCTHVFFGDVPFGFVKLWKVGIPYVFAIDVGEDHMIR
jgi:hypothetical protein